MQGIRQYQLLEDLRPGRSAKAALLRWDAKLQKYIVSKEQIELFEFVGSHGDKGDRGYGYLSPESGRWETVSGLYEQTAQWIPS